MKIVADANIPFVRECFSSLGEVEVVAGREITSDIVADADALLVRSITPVNAKLLATSSVKFVATATIGFDHVDPNSVVLDCAEYQTSVRSPRVSTAMLSGPYFDHPPAGRVLECVAQEVDQNLCEPPRVCSHVGKVLGDSDLDCVLAVLALCSQGPDCVLYDLGQASRARRDVDPSRLDASKVQ